MTSNFGYNFIFDILLSFCRTPLMMRIKNCPSLLFDDDRRTRDRLERHIRDAGGSE